MSVENPEDGLEARPSVGASEDSQPSGGQQNSTGRHGQAVYIVKARVGGGGELVPRGASVDALENARALDSVAVVVAFAGSRVDGSRCAGLHHQCGHRQVGYEIIQGCPTSAAV